MSLRVFQHCSEISAFLLHPSEDVIAGAVDNAVEMGHAIADEAFAQRFDHRDAAANAGFEIKISAGLACGGDEFLAMSREERFIGGFDRHFPLFARFNE